MTESFLSLTELSIDLDLSLTESFLSLIESNTDFDLILISSFLSLTELSIDLDLSLTESFLSLIESNTDFDFCIGSLFLSNFLDIKSIIPSIPILVAILERDISFSSIDVSKASPMVDAVLDFLNNF